MQQFLHTKSLVTWKCARILRHITG